MPEEDIQLIIEDRIVVPTRVEAQTGSPTERLLKSKLNPETEKGNNEEIETFVTDDATLSKFMEKLMIVINKKES